MEFRRAHGTCAYAASSALVDDAPACGMIGFVPILTGPVVPAGGLGRDRHAAVAGRVGIKRFGLWEGIGELAGLPGDASRPRAPRRRRARGLQLGAPRHRARAGELVQAARGISEAR